MKHRPPLWGIAVIVAALVVASGCSDEELPSSPPPPFLFTSLALSSDALPRPGTPLQVGQEVRLQYGVAFTLDPAMFEQRTQLAVFVNVFGVDANDNSVNIGDFPDRQFTPELQGANQLDTIAFTVPAGITQVWVEAFLDTIPFSNPVVALDRLIWPVQ